MPGKKANSAAKATTKKRSLNVGNGKPGGGAPFNDQDVKRRTGNFGTAGEHPHIGGRTSGIVGQTKRKFATNKKTKKP